MDILPEVMGDRAEILTHQHIIEDLERRNFPSASIVELEVLLHTYNAGYQVLSYYNPRDRSLDGWGIFVPKKCDLRAHDDNPSWVGLSVFGRESKVEYGLYSMENYSFQRRAKIVNTGLLASGAAWILEHLTPAIAAAHQSQVHLNPLAAYLEDATIKINGWRTSVGIDIQRGWKDYTLVRQDNGFILHFGLRPLLPMTLSKTLERRYYRFPEEQLAMFFYHENDVGIEKLRTVTAEIIERVTPIAPSPVSVAHV